MILSWDDAVLCSIFNTANYTYVDAKYFVGCNNCDFYQTHYRYSLNSQVNPIEGEIFSLYSELMILVVKPKDSPCICEL